MPSFLADRTNGRAYVTVLCRLSDTYLSVCNVCIVAKRRVVLKNWTKEANMNGSWGIEWSLDRRHHVTLKGP